MTNFFTLANVREQLIHNGKEPSFRVWRGPSTSNSLNEKWEKFRRPTIRQNPGFDSQVDNCGMVEDVFHKQMSQWHS
jgi:hypothetical protein